MKKIGAEFVCERSAPADEDVLGGEFRIGPMWKSRGGFRVSAQLNTGFGQYYVNSPHCATPREAYAQLQLELDVMKGAIVPSTAGVIDDSVCTTCVDRVSCFRSLGEAEAFLEAHPEFTPVNISLLPGASSPCALHVSFLDAIVQLANQVDSGARLAFYGMKKPQLAMSLIYGIVHVLGLESSQAETICRANLNPSLTRHIEGHGAASAISNLCRALKQEMDKKFKIPRDALLPMSTDSFYGAGQLVDYFKDTLNTKKRQTPDFVDDIPTSQRCGPDAVTEDMRILQEGAIPPTLGKDEFNGISEIWDNIVHNEGGFETGIAAMGKHFGDNSKYSPSQWLAHPITNPFRSYISALGADSVSYLEKSAEEQDQVTAESGTVKPDADGLPCFKHVGSLKFGVMAPDKVKSSQPLEKSFIDIVRDVTDGAIDFEGKTPEGDPRMMYSAPSGREAVDKSVTCQAAENHRANCSTAFVRKGITFNHLKSTYRAYPRGYTALLSMYDDTDGRNGETHNGILGSFTNFIETFDGKKSAGISGRYRSRTTKAAWIGSEEAVNELFHITLVRLILRAIRGPRKLSQLTPLQLLAAGLVDPRSLFIKDEPHSYRKWLRGAFRVIFNVSIIDQVCQGMLHNYQNKADIEGFQEGKVLCQANGMGHDDSGIQRMGLLFEEAFHDRPEREGVTISHLCSDDASGYDWSVTRDGLNIDASRRCFLARPTPFTPRSPDEEDDVDYRRLGFNHAIMCESCCNSSHVLLIGTYLWESQRFGITGSGMPSTAGQNSPMRRIICQLSGVYWALTMGDDLLYAVEFGNEPDRAFMADCGVRNKGSAVAIAHGEPMSFTSHLYSKDAEGVWTATYENLDKMLARVGTRLLLPESQQPDEVTKRDIMNALLFVCRADVAQCNVIHAVATAIGWPITEANPAGLGLIEEVMF